MREVLLTERAQRDLDQSYDWWAENRSLGQANRWYSGFMQALLALEHEPERFPLAPESEHFPIEVRQLNYGLGSKPTHRALYTVRTDRVVIVRVRHLAQEPLASDEL